MMSKRRILISHHSRQRALRFLLFLVWLTLVICLPKTGSNVVGTIGVACGITYGLIKYAEWGDDPSGYPKWGCFLSMKMASLEFKEDIERNLTSEQKAQLAEHMQKQTLLRAAKMESEPEQELLRPATDVGETNSGELLRSSDKYPFKNNLRFSR